MSKQSITTRMQALRVDVEAHVEDRHVAAIRRELRAAPAPTPVRAPRGVRRRVVVTLMATFALLLPVVAFAAEESVPGDVLYPVKQSTEWARSLVDHGVARQHRVQELEIVIDRNAPIGVIADRFEDSVSAVDGLSPELTQRVDQARETVRERYGVDLGIGKTPRSGTEQRNGQGATDRSDSNTTTESIEPPTDSGATGPNTDTGTGDTTTPSTARSTTGQPDGTPEPGSGGNRP